MSLIDFGAMGVSDSEEPIAVKPDNEYKLRIIDVTEGEDKNGHDYLLPRLEVVGEPLAKDFTYFLGLTHEEMDEKTLNKAKWKIRSFCECFDLDPAAEQNPKDDWAGQEGWAILGLKKDDEYGEQNFIRKLILPK